MDEALSDNEQSQLRKAGTISEQEVALQVGDLLIAENVITRERRVINRSPAVNESQGNRQLLRD